jgi:hypothetical protein
MSLYYSNDFFFFILSAESIKMAVSFGVAFATTKTDRLGTAWTPTRGELVAFLASTEYEKDMGANERATSIDALLLPLEKTENYKKHPTAALNRHQLTLLKESNEELSTLIEGKQIEMADAAEKTGAGKVVATGVSKAVSYYLLLSCAEAMEKEMDKLNAGLGFSVHGSFGT